MKMSENIIYKIKLNQNIPKYLLFEIKRAEDGNCWYRTLSKYFTVKKDNHKVSRRLIYEVTKNNKQNLLPFFLEE